MLNWYGPTPDVGVIVIVPSVDKVDGTPVEFILTLVRLQNVIFTSCSKVHSPAEPVTIILYSPGAKFVKLFVSVNVCPPSILYWNGLTPENTLIKIEPSLVSTELAFS